MNGVVFTYMIETTPSYFVFEQKRLYLKLKPVHNQSINIKANSCQAEGRKLTCNEFEERYLLSWT